MADLSVTGEVVVNSEQAESAFNRVGDKAQQMATEVATSAGKAGQAVDKIGDGAGASAEKFTRAEARMRDAIKKSTQELQLLGKTASEKIEFNINTKGLDAAKFAPYIAELKQAEAAQRIATNGLDNMGMSAKATAAALRGVPAQFQDIIVSLQGGQAPVTVFLQQGSQLSGMFGGAGAAAKALGGYVLGLVNPFTLAAAAAAALGIAMYSINGKDAALRELSVQLTGTGRASAAAVGDIKTLVNELNLVPGVTKESATAILTEFAKVSGVGSSLFKGLGSSVADFAAATGTDLPTAAKKLAEAFADPAKGAKTFEESLGTLTAAQILNIEKMSAMGDKSGAQIALLEALKQATSGLAEQGMTPLGQSTDKLSNSWDALTTSVGNSNAFRTANDWLATLISSVADLTLKLSQMNPPTWLRFLPSVGPAIGALGLLGGGPSPSAQSTRQRNTGGATGSWAPSESDVDRQVKSALDATRTYESQAAAMTKLRGVATQATEALKALESQNKGNSLEAATLRERIAGVNEKLSEMGKKGSTGPKGGDEFASQREAAKEWARYVEQFSKAADEATAKSEGLTKSQATLSEYLQSPAYKNASEPMRETALQMAYAAIKQEQLNAQTKIAAQIAKEAANSHAKYIDELSRGSMAVEQQIDKMRMEEEAASIASQGYYSLAEAIELVTIARLKEKRDGLLGNEDAFLAVQKEIEAREKLMGVIRSTEARKASEDAAKQAQSDWQRASEEINRSLTDALLRGFESGKSFAQNLRDTLANMFKTLILRPTISAIISPIAGALSMTGTANAATAGASGLGTLGSIGSAISMGTSAFGIGASYGAQSLFANGLTGTLTAGSQMIGAGSIMSGLGTIAGALGPIALGIGALSAIIGKTKGETRTGGQFGVAFDGQVTNNRRGETYTFQGQQFDRDFSNGRRDALVDGQAYRLEGDPVQNEKAIRDAIAGTAKGINDMFEALGSSAALASFSAGLETSGKGRGGVFAGGTLADGTQFGESGKGDNYAGTLYEAFSTNSPDFKTALENFTLDLKQSTVQALQAATDIPKSIQEMLKDVDAEALTDESANALLAAINTQIAGVEQFRAALSNMGLDRFSDMAFDAAAAVAEASGGFENLGSNLSSYYENFYSEAEKTANSARLIEAALAEVGLAMPTTNEGFRELVEGQMALGASGAEALAALLAVNDEFYALTEGAASAAEALGITTDGLASIISDSVRNASSKGEASEMASSAFEKQFYDGILNTMASNLSQGLMSAIVGPMLTSLVGGAVASGTALAAGGAAGASATAMGGAQAAGAMAAGGAQAAGAMAAGGAAVGAQVGDFLANAQDYINSFVAMLSNSGIRDSIGQIGGLIGGVAGNLYEGMNTFFIESKAMPAVGGSLSSAMGGVKDSMQDLTDSLVEEVKRIRGLIEEGAEATLSLAALKSQFAIATAQARAGDKEAAAKLPELSQRMLELAEKNASSSAELRLIQATTAASLQATAEALVKKYGGKLPSFAVGTNEIPFDMVAQVHQGERIIPAADNRALIGAIQRNGTAGDSQAAMQVMDTRFQKMQDHLAEIERNTKRVDDVINNWSRNGAPVVNQEGTTLETTP